ncbi:MAG: PTS sugar transporter subunit IIC [Calditrichaeota bacterium]|nr:PTS sugar transporter subunit IIC [Calditrichota bacterium]MCB0267266.1 PTS sugar transporter subunit IIC [Calditrichota bacterium]MCB0285942.1 PTS sugar transporter subunit IIC [Calditrichota bacterium]MCB0299520.1 PTS sugar transporter subunit IIC [Calditrichota bacterium]MCB9068828.1 PTS sugar transporter subunit IIC [Calditrichia bacterium]
MSNFSLALLISLLGLDTTIAFQVLISQPVFACSIIGWLMGDPMTGMEIGAIMQMIWLNMLPVGAASFPEGNIASMLVCVIVIRFADLDIPNTVFAVAFVYGMIVSYVGAQLTTLDRRLNTRILKWAQQAAEQADLRKLTLLDMLSIAFYLIIMVFLSFIMLWLADVIFPLLSSLPPSWETRLQFVKPVVWGIGIALTAALIIRKKPGKN